MIKEACRNFTSDRKKVVEENNREVRLLNGNAHYMCVIRIDSCQIDNATERCDFLVEIYSDDKKNVVKAIFIELKGGDVKKGISQLSNTTHHFLHYFSKQMKEAILVCSRVPTVGTDIQKAKIQFFKKYNCKLYIKNRYFDYEVKNSV